MSTPPTPDSAPDWIATTATVTTCNYQSPSLGPLAFGFNASGRQKFRITFDYYAHGRLYSGEFQSAVAVPQNETIPVSYNPMHPQQNSRDPGSADASSRRPPSLIAIGITGSIFLSLFWLVMLRSCH
jgi:hypothetical protein